MLERIKTALRITTTAFDAEIEDLIADSLAELRMLGVTDAQPEDASIDSQIVACVIYYAKARFGANQDAERWERIYYDKVTKLMNASGYGLTE